MRRASLVTNSQVVARGSVTQANMRISAVDGGATASGGAFVDFGAADVLTGKIGHLLKIYDSSKRVIQGYIKAAGTGETLGGELIDAWVNVGYDTFTVDGTDIDEATETGGTSSYCKKTVGTPLGLHKLVVGSFTKVSGVDPYIAIFGSTSLSIPDRIINPAIAGTTYITKNLGSATGFRSSNNTSWSASDISLKQVLTPSATGVTITSQKGNVTYNWAAKQTSFNYNDASGYTYEILKVYDLKEVSGFGGSGQTAANQHVSTVAANAFFFSDDLDFTPYLDGRHYLRLKDAAGIVSWGKIKGAVPGGLGTTDLITGDNSTFASDTGWWTVQAGWAITGGKLVKSVSGTAQTYKSSLLTTGSCYQWGVDVDAISGTIILNFGITPTTGLTTTGAGKVGYFTSINSINGVNFYAAGSVTATIDNTVLRKITTPPATGCIIANSLGAESFEVVPTAFNPNNITDVRVFYAGSPRDTQYLAMENNSDVLLTEDSNLLTTEIAEV